MSDDFDPYHVWLGIPPDEQPPNHYRLLGLRLHEADDDVISNALDQRLAFLRTLQAGKRGALSQKLLNEVAAAGTVLLDRKKKKAYDEQLKASQPAAAAPANQLAAGTKSTLRTARPLPTAQPIAEVVPIPEPVAYVQVPMPHPMQPQVPQQPAYVVQIPVLASPPHYAPPPEPLAPVATISTIPATARRRSLRGGALAISIVAACAIVLAATVGGVIWWLQQGQSPISNVPPTIPTTPGPETPTPPTDAIPPGPTPTVPTPVTSAPVTPPAATSPSPNDPRKVWVYADNSRGGLRHVDGDRWVELSESAAIWYMQRETTPDAITLQQVGGSPVTVKLLADRMIHDDIERTGPTVFFGKWRSLEGLPPFARRDPGQVQLQPPPNRNEVHYGLLFDGHSQIEIPLPSELQKPAAKFTIELMARWLDPRKAACLLECGDLRLWSHPAQPGGGALLALESGGKELQFGFPGVREHTYYPTIICDGSSVQVLMNGSPLSLKLPPPSLGSGPLLVGRDSRGERGFRGLLLGLRVSEFDRLATVRAPATLPRALVADDLTLATIEMRRHMAGKVAIVPSNAGEGKRIGVQWVPMDYLHRLAAESKPGEVNLLRAFIPQEHILGGRMSSDGKELQIRNPKGTNVLHLPYLPPSRYRVEANVARTGGDGGIVFGLLLDDQPAFLLIDTPFMGKRMSGLVMGANRLSAGDTRAVTPAEISAAWQPVVCDVVAENGRAMIRVRVSEKLVFSLDTEIRSISLPDDLPLRSKSMFIGSSEGTFKIDRLVLLPLPDDSPLARMTPLPVPGEPPFGTPRPMPPMPVSTTKRPPPDAATLARELEKARDIYADRLAKATRPEQKATLATDIQKDAASTSGDPTARYVLIDLARKVFVQAGAVEEALAAAALISEEYDVSEADSLTATLEALDGASLVAKQRVVHAQAALSLAERLVGEEKIAEAGKLATMAGQSITRQSDATLKRTIGQRSARIGRITTGWDAAQVHVATLAAKPDDPDANLALGKFYCFVCERWPQGTEHLVKSDNPAFAAPSKLDREAADGKSRYAAAEAWLDLAGSSNLATKDEKQSAQRRAKRLLEMAIAGLEGLDKIKAEKRLDSLGDVGDAPTDSVAPEGKPVADAAAANPLVSPMKGVMLGRVYVNEKLTDVVVRYQAGARISNDHFAKIVAATGVPVTEMTSLRVQFEADLVVKRPTRVYFAHAVSPGAISTFLLNQTNSLNDARNGKGKTVAVDLPAGRSGMVWMIENTRDFDGAELDFKTSPGASSDYEFELSPSASKALSSVKPDRIVRVVK